MTGQRDFSDRKCRIIEFCLIKRSVHKRLENGVRGGTPGNPLVMTFTTMGCKVEAESG